MGINNYFYKKNDMLNSLIDVYLKRISEEARLNDFIISIILVGSISRGEGSYLVDNNKILITSDIEFIVVTKKQMNIEVYHDIELKFQKFGVQIFNMYSHLMHFDFTFMSIKRFKRIGRSLFTYEMRSLGKTIYGDYLLDQLPIITVRNISKLDILDIILHRMFSVIYYGINNRNILERELIYIFAKNTLDLLTVDIYSKGIILPGFSNRIDYLLKNEDKFNEDNKKLYLVSFEVKKEVNSNNINSKYLLNGFLRLINELYPNSKHLSSLDTFYNWNMYIRRFVGIFIRNFNKRVFSVSYNSHYKSMLELIKQYINQEKVDHKLYKKVLIEHHIMFNFPSVVEDIL